MEINLEQRRLLVLRTGITCLLLAIGFSLAGCGFSHTYRHRQLVERVDAQVLLAREPLRRYGRNGTPFARLDDNSARAEIVEAIRTALMNEFWYPEKVSEAKLRVIAEHLETTHGRDFETVQGCLKVMDLLEDACPTVRNYATFRDIHEAQEVGNIPKFEGAPRR